VFSNFIPQSGTVVQEYLVTFSDQARQLTFFGLVFLLVTAFLMLSTIERSFNEIWRVDKPRKGLSKFLLYWAVLTLGPLLAVLGLMVTTYVVSLPLISDVEASVGFLQFVPVLLSVLVFTLIYAAVPNCPVLLRHALLGGLVVALLFELAKKAFTELVALSSFELIYGAFASVPLFLLWLYLAWILILGGAELVRGMAVYDSATTGEQEAPLFQILAVLNTLFVAHQRGEALSELKIVRGEEHLDQEKWNTYRKLLLELQLIKRLDTGEFVLSRDLREISVWQLHKNLPWSLPERGLVLNKKWQKSLSDKLEQVSKENSLNLDMSLDSLLRQE
jgi:membrane protein